MGLFGDDAWEHLNTPDIKCSCNGNDNVFNQWRVSLGICVTSFFLAMLNLIINYKTITKTDTVDVDGWEKRYGRYMYSIIKAFREEGNGLLGYILGDYSITRRRSPVWIRQILLGSVCFFSLILILFQRFPDKVGAPLGVIIIIAPFMSYLIYHMNTSQVPKGPVANEAPCDKKYWTYTPRNVYQDLSAPLIHPLLIFAMQVILTFIYVLAVFDERFPPCINDNNMAWVLYMFAALLKAFYYGVDTLYICTQALDDRKLWTESYDKLFPKGNGYTVAWASHPPLTKDLSESEWYLRCFLDSFVNYSLYWILYFFMVIQAANGNLQDFVLNFVAADFILRLDDYSTNGFEGYFCIVKNGNVPNELPTTALEDVKIEMKVCYVENLCTRKKDKESELRLTRKVNELEVRGSNNEDEEKELRLRFSKENKELITTISKLEEEIQALTEEQNVD